MDRDRKTHRLRGIIGVGGAPPDSLYTLLMGGFSMAMLVLLGLPIVTFFVRAVSFGGPVVSPLWQAVALSLGTTALSMVGIVLLGTPTAIILAHYDFPFKRIITVFIDLPIVMPPVVAGLALLTAFGRRGVLGAQLAAAGVTIPFTPAAVVLAQMFVAAPYYIRAVQFRLTALPSELEEAAQIDGASRWAILRHILLPLSFPAMMSGLLLSWARALGEFGATILFAGNLAGRTQTMPLLVYSALERDLGATFTTAAVLIGLALVIMMGVRVLTHLDDSDSMMIA